MKYRYLTMIEMETQLVLCLLQTHCICSYGLLIVQNMVVENERVTNHDKTPSTEVSFGSYI